MHILILDDHPSSRRAFRRLLPARMEITVSEASSLDEALMVLQKAPLDLLFLDVRLTGAPDDRSGLEFLRRARAYGCFAPAIVLTGIADLDVAREAMRAGAQDYLLKTELSTARVRTMLELFDPSRTTSSSRIRASIPFASTRPPAIEQGDPLSSLIGSSRAMTELRSMLVCLAAARSPVLIRGATGSGKDVVARALHALSPSRARPFVAIDCAAVPTSLVESQLFGHEPGAFVGAERRVAGYLARAEGGALLLDEVAELPLEAQAKLLRAIESGSFRPLGADSDVQFGARLLASTHVDLELRQREGRFRADLYYRLAVIELPIPSLEDHLEDLPELVAFFMKSAPRPIVFTEDALGWLAAHPWPGNVRQLRNAVERVALLAPSERVDASTLDTIASGTLLTCQTTDLERVAASFQQLPGSLGDKLEAIERLVIEDALRRSGNNKAAAARLLGVERKALDRRLQRFGGGAGGE